MIKKIIISGKGGDGVQFIGMLLSKTAISLGLSSTLIKSYGPEARGGRSTVFIVISDEKIGNPVMKTADVLIAFDDESLDVWKDKVRLTLGTRGVNNMFALGILLNRLNVPGLVPESTINVMKKEISSKYSNLFEDNVKKINEGYKQ